MEDIKENEQDKKSTISEEEDFKKYIICTNPINLYDTENLINKENTEDLICPICFYIYNNPESCSDKKNSHSFCKACIDNYLKNNNNCPTCKLNFEHQTKKEIIDALNKLSFQCIFKKEGCKEITNYNEYLKHINNCKYFVGEYECNIKKYNYKKKDFEKCGFVGNKTEIEKHYKLCGLVNYNCLFCKEKILLKNLEDHVMNKCKFRIINYEDGSKYIGEINNNMKNGYGVFYLSNGVRYLGQFKNDKSEGYGILYYYDSIVYKGEFKNDCKEGYGIVYYSNDSRYEGELKNNLRDGYGTVYYNDGKYEGEFKNNAREGHGILYFSDGSRYEGELKNNLRGGFGTFYYSNGEKYQGKFKENMREGYGIFYYSNGDTYKGEYKNNIKEGYGMIHLHNGLKYKGEFKNDKIEGYGKKYNPFNDIIYEGEFKDGKKDGCGIDYKPNGEIYEGEFKNDLREG